MHTLFRTSSEHCFNTLRSHRLPQAMNNSVDNDNSSESTTLPRVADLETGIVISPLLVTIHTVTLSFVSVVGFFGNLAVFAAFGLNAKLRSKPFNLILLNLTLADFGVSCIIPFTIVYEQLGFWPLDVAACFFYILVDYGMTTMSALTMVLISVDRCWAACWSTTYRTLNTRKRTMLCIAALWLVLIDCRQELNLVTSAVISNLHCKN